MTVPRSDPSTQGVAPEGIAALLDALEADPGIEPHGLIVQRNGQRIVEGYWAPHSADRSRLVYSLSKSFTAAALALQVSEGRLGLDDLVSDHLPDEMAGADPRTRELRVRHLASMSTGHDHETLGESFLADPEDLVRGFFRQAPTHEPGTVFAYNQPPIIALATILQRLAGERLSTYLRPRLLDPLGVHDFRWRELRPGLEFGFTGIYTTLDAVARLGQLHLDDGIVDGQRLFPEGWIDAASHPQVASPGEPSPDWQQGYGFGLWMSRHGYRGDGGFGQLMVMLPEQRAVVALFSNSTDFQALLDLLWTHLLPAMAPQSTGSGGDDDALATRLATLALPTVGERRGGAPPEPSTMTLSPGPPGPTTHRTVTAIDLEGDTVVLHEGEARIRVPMCAEWTPVPGRSIAASAAQLPSGEIAVDLVLLDTPHRLELALDPAESTFIASWPAVPFFGAGIAPELTDMHTPDD